MTLLSELIEIPEQVHKSDFVISLATAIEEPERTVQDYVVTDQLADCFDRALYPPLAPFGDWLQVGVETPRDRLATAYFARSASLVSKAAEGLGQTGEARRYAELAGRVGDAFAAEFVRPDGTVGEGTQTGYLMAQAFSLVPPPIAGRKLLQAVR